MCKIYPIFAVNISILAFLFILHEENFHYNPARTSYHIDIFKYIPKIYPNNLLY